MNKKRIIVLGLCYLSVGALFAPGAPAGEGGAKPSESRSELEQRREEREQEQQRREQELERARDTRRTEELELERLNNERAEIERQREQREREVLEREGIDANDPRAQDVLRRDDQYRAIEQRLNDKDITIGEHDMTRLQAMQDALEASQQLDIVNTELSDINAQLERPEWKRRVDAIVSSVTQAFQEWRQNKSSSINNVIQRVKDSIWASLIATANNIMSTGRFISGRLNAESSRMENDLIAKQDAVREAQSLFNEGGGMESEAVQLIRDALTEMRDLRVAESEGTLDAKGEARLQELQDTARNLLERAEGEELRVMNELQDRANLLVDALVERNRTQSDIDAFGTMSHGMRQVVQTTRDINLSDRVAGIAESLFEGGTPELGRRLNVRTSTVHYQDGSSAEVYEFIDRQSGVNEQARIDKLQNVVDGIKPDGLDPDLRSALKQRLQEIRDVLSRAQLQLADSSRTLQKDIVIATSSAEQARSDIVQTYEENMGKEGFENVPIQIGENLISGRDRMLYALEYYKLVEPKLLTERTPEELDLIFDSLTQEQVDQAVQQKKLELESLEESEQVQQQAMERQMNYFIRSPEQRGQYSQVLKYELLQRLDRPEDANAGWDAYYDALGQGLSFLTPETSFNYISAMGRYTGQLAELIGSLDTQIALL
ncbi:hypothetical protein JW872_02510 [Candidatus Babeliales bacterium]|nr:hypothetical protein [Candidatus Babeliales bacterium]